MKLKLTLTIFAILLASQIALAQEFSQGLNLTATCDDGSTVNTTYDNSQIDIQFNNNGQVHYMLATLPSAYLTTIFLPYSIRTKTDNQVLEFAPEHLNGMTISPGIAIRGETRDLHFVYESDATHPRSFLTYIPLGKYTNVEGEIHMYFSMTDKSKRPVRVITVYESYFDKNQNKSVETHLRCNVVD